LIIGDAAHNQVPFYGLGLNTGFEDLTLLFSRFPTSGPINLESIFEQYSKIRTPDCHAVADLSLHNYYEMASGVTSRGYKLRKTVEDFLYGHARWTGILPLYTMVSFGSMGFSEIRKKWIRQGKILKFTGWVSALSILAVTSYMGRNVLRNR
jgi:kynurenine 3-monooxygenase